MKILTTGGAGSIGSATIEMLENAGHTVSDASLENGTDLLNSTEFDAFFTPDAPQVILHFAEHANNDLAYEEQENYQGTCFRMNVELTRRIAEYALKHDAHLLYFSSAYVFDGSQLEPYKETDQAEPENWYGKTKYLGEREIIASGANYTIIRTSYPFGSIATSTQDLIASLALHLQEGTLEPLFTDQMFTPTYAPDIARAISILLQNLEISRNTIFNLVGDDVLSPYELAERVQAQLMLFDPIDKVSLSASEKNRGADVVQFPKNLALSNEKFKKAFDFTFTPLDKALAEVL